MRNSFSKMYLKKRFAIQNVNSDINIALRFVWLDSPAGHAFNTENGILSILKQNWAL